MLFDSHAHLNDETLINHVDEIIENAKKNNVTKMVCVGWDRDSSELAVQLASQHPGIYAAVGLHPSEVTHKDNDLDWIKDLITHEKVVAIGEIGLDYYWDKSLQEAQKAVFVKQMQIAREHQLPVIVHMRDATSDTLEMLKQHLSSESGGVMHCYSASEEVMWSFIDLGLYISLAGPVTFKNARVPKAVAKAIPLDKLLVETDSPYLAPVPFRGKTNEPKNVRYVADEIARIKGLTKEAIETATYDNTCKLFKIKDKEVTSWD